MLDVMKAIGRAEGLTPLHGTDGAWESVVRLPRSEGRGLLWLAEDHEHLFFTRAVDTWDSKLASAIMRFTKQHESELRDPRPLAVVDGFVDPRGKFDTIAAVSHVVHQMWTPINPRVTKLTVVLYPIYRCELSGHESADVLSTLIPRLLYIGDWNRDPSPIAWMRFSNTRTGVKTTNKGFGVDTADTLYDAIADMTKQGSVTEAKNFKDQLLRFEYREGALWVTVPGEEPKKTAKKAALSVAKRFLEHGL